MLWDPNNISEMQIRQARELVLYDDLYLLKEMEIVFIVVWQLLDYLFRIA